MVRTTAGLTMAEDLMDLTNGQANSVIVVICKLNFISKHKLFDILAISGDMDFGGDFLPIQGPQEGSTTSTSTRAGVASIN